MPLLIKKICQLIIYNVMTKGSFNKLENISTKWNMYSMSKKLRPSYKPFSLRW